MAYRCGVNAILIVTILSLIIFFLLRYTSLGDRTTAVPNVMNVGWCSNIEMDTITVASHEYHGYSEHRQLDDLFNSLIRVTHLCIAVSSRGKSTSDLWIALTNGQKYGELFHVITFPLAELLCIDVCITGNAVDLCYIPYNYRRTITQM